MLRASLTFLGLPFVLASSGAVAEPLAPQSVAAKELVADARRERALTVSVQLAVAPDAGDRKQVGEIAKAQRAFVAKHRLEARIVRTFDNVPYIVVELTEQQMTEVLADPAVVSVEPESFQAPQLDQSTAIVHADRIADANGTAFDGSGQVVVVLDSGQDATHAFIAGRAASGACFSTGGEPKLPAQGIQSLCPNGAGTQTGDAAAGTSCAIAGSCGHGTRVAGIVAGSGTGVPRRGVAPGARLVPIQIFTQHSDYPAAGSVSAKTTCADYGETSPCLLVATSDRDAAFDWVLSEVKAGRLRNVAAVNASIGGGSPVSTPCNRSKLASLVEQLWTEGVAVVISSGNLSSANANALGVLSPSCIQRAVTVSGTRDNDTMNPRAANGSLTDLLAPGVDITTSDRGGGWLTATGTSYAAPHVAAAFAILAQASPRSTVEQRLAALVDTGLSVSDTRGQPSTTFAKPRIDIEAAADLLHCRLADDECFIVDVDANGAAKVLFAQTAGWRGRTVRLFEDSYQSASIENDLALPSDAKGRVVYLSAQPFAVEEGALYDVEVRKVADDAQSGRLRRLFP